jgi:uncharacterized OB-fold protein
LKGYDVTYDPVVTAPENAEAALKRAGGALPIKRCRDCGDAHYYPRPICPFCHSADTGWENSKGIGTIYSFSVSRHASAAPVIAYVELSEGPIILTNIAGAAPEEVAIGMTVNLAMKDDDEWGSVPVFTLGPR